ncbi:MAG: DHH family phosphoesterase [Actinomycetota bacterium]
MSAAHDVDGAAIAAAVDRAAALIGGATEVALACHVGPDGDALGSMLALHHALSAAGVRSVASFPEPFTIADHYRGLPGLDRLVPPADFPAEPEVMVTFDCGSLARLGGLEQAAKAAAELVVIDHHVSNDRYGSVNVVDPTAAASGVVVRRLLGRMGLPLDRDVATCLYVALVCDTGRFQYEATDAAVFSLAAELAEFGLPIAELSRQLFEEHSFAYLRLLADALARTELRADTGLVWTSVTQADLAGAGVAYEEVEGLIDVVRRAREAEVACVLKEAADGAWRVSLRSLGTVDVCRIAEAHGGGGHRFAAGFTTDEPADAVIGSIAAAIAGSR